MPDKLDLLQDLIKKVKIAGADQADAVLFSNSSISAKVRVGNPETVEHADSKSLGLRALVGKRQAIISTNDFSSDVLSDLINKVLDMARAAPEDQYTGLADKELLATETIDLDIDDKDEPSPKLLLEMAKNLEAAAFAVPGVTNSEGAEISFSRSEQVVVTSDGFAKSYKYSYCSSSAAVIAGEGTNMQTDYAYTSSCHFNDLKSPEAIGKEAGERAIKKLNPQKVKTCQVPIIFEAREAKNLVSNFSSAVNGAAIARGTSFLKDGMGKQIFSKNIQIIDDPFIVRGLGSQPFDAEGIKGKKNYIVKDGVLSSWLLDSRSARQLGLKSTGNADRGIASPPHPSNTNFYLENGSISVRDMIKGVSKGIYITEAFGMGVNNITGDYSQGASGFWIENGEITYPVSEITIAGHLLDMFKNLIPANDLEMLYSTNSPTLLIEGMTVAGL